ncbi:MAG: DUF4338 domain-containing protein [Acidobacteria bacterium]|nr:DUF4338 domain-containing protein [Acidobacteriota bacterium]
MPDHELPGSVTFCGRTFSAPELELIEQIAREFASLGVTEISRTICELLDWKRPSGRLKNHECRQLLEQLREQGWLRLPEVRQLGPRGPRRVPVTAQSEPQAPMEGSAGEYEPLRLTVVEADSRDSALWMELVQRHHYLGYRVPVGGQLRYLVRSAPCSDRVLACLQWTSAAWKMAVRDRWIGWSAEERMRNLPFIVNNSRFLILPWVRVKGLASKILAHCARQLPADWERRYGYRPLLLETLVDQQRFAGTCYRAANWILLGETQGRGRMDRYHQADGSARKLVFVYPLCLSAQQQLHQASPLHFTEPEPD